MANERITDLPGVASASLSDIIYAVQGASLPGNLGTSVQETLAQVFALLVAGSNISIATVGGNKVISATGTAGVGWTNVTGLTQAMVADSGYVADSSAGTVVFTLPSVAPFGSILYIQGYGSSGWQINQNVSQQIIIGSSASTLGNTGSIASTNANDSIVLLCTQANVTFSSLGGPQGNITIV